MDRALFSADVDLAALVFVAFWRIFTISSFLRSHRDLRRLSDFPVCLLCCDFVSRRTRLVASSHVRPLVGLRSTNSDDAKCSLSWLWSTTLCQRCRSRAVFRCAAALLPLVSARQPTQIGGLIKFRCAAHSPTQLFLLKIFCLFLDVASFLLSMLYTVVHC